MTVSPKKLASVSIRLRVPADLYRRAARRADGASFHYYLTALICSDLGIDPESQDLVFNQRREWNLDHEGDGPRYVYFLLPKPIHAALKAKLDALPYPVLLSQYLRRLIEKDVGR